MNGIGRLRLQAPGSRLQAPAQGSGWENCCCRCCGVVVVVLSCVSFFSHYGSSLRTTRVEAVLATLAFFHTTTR